MTYHTNDIREVGKQRHTFFIKFLYIALVFNFLCQSFFDFGSFQSSMEIDVASASVYFTFI